MATSTVARAGKMVRILFLVLACAVSLASAGPASVFTMDNVPDWLRSSAMTLQITAPDGFIVPLTYTVAPLTASLGLNQTAVSREAVMIQGNIVSVNAANFVNVTDPTAVAFISCDVVNASFSPNEIINMIMDNRPKAILLYSTKASCCGLEGSDLPYQSIFTMTDPGEAAETFNITDSTPTNVQATIAGNTTAPDSDEENNQNGSNSAVAMSILYSITGLITLLFLIIIATGAIRAHRYPERYGPRSGYGGRPRQSRAKGIARAVLETLPVVKFGGPEPGKPDPARELDLQPPRPSHDPNMGTRLSAIPEEPQRRPSEAPDPALNLTAPAAPAAAAKQQENGANGSTKGEDEHLGCSICTEDFTVGEDVRVLPCNHKFHPCCIDPWLMNISGTCPLCRLDLRPREEGSQEGSQEDSTDSTHLPPPLEGEGGEHGSENGSEHESHAGQRRRTSRLLDLHRLRHASIEERIEILRRHRSQQQESAAGAARQGSADRSAESPDRLHRTRLADRLREKFHIRTRVQSPARGSSTDQRD